ncbi:MAG: YbhB/YbcL family Raf kinase inhibitor-like protein [Oligoflexia bacterium]|nr:YbhB/YbcL family Raf kinase inhibitor-like protein [Oligoflexia bacterium]
MRWRTALVWLGCLVLLAGAALPSAAAQTPSSSSLERSVMHLQSTAFGPGDEIPAEHTCQGANISPPLAWSDLPAGTKSLVLIIDDPDAPDPAAPKMTWVHWVLYDIPPDTTSLAQAVSTLPPGTRQGTNSWGRTGYGGPCPPIGRHRYFHKLFALDAVLGDLGDPDVDALMAAARSHILGNVELVGTYQKR